VPNAATAAAPDPAAVDAAARILRRARSVLFVTGAGISADSGLPTYRGVGGLYESDATEEGLPIEVLLSGETFRRRPATTWKYLGAIERACRGARPNRAHEAIAALEGALPRVVVLTQNIDGLHRAAGSRDVIEIHGDVHRLACTRCAFRARVPDYEGFEMPPRCPECAALVRPERSESCQPFDGQRLRCPGPEWNFSGLVLFSADQIIRRCIWLHPVEGARHTLTFEGVELGDHLRGFCALDDRVLLPNDHRDVELVVSIDGQELGRAACPARRGWHAWSFPTPGLVGRRAEVSIASQAAFTGRRHFCFTAYATREDP